MDHTASDPHVMQQYGMIVGKPNAGQLNAIATINIRGERSVTCKGDFDLHPSKGPLPAGAPPVCEFFRHSISYGLELFQFVLLSLAILSLSRACTTVHVLASVRPNNGGLRRNRDPQADDDIGEAARQVQMAQRGVGLIDALVVLRARAAAEGGILRRSVEDVERLVGRQRFCFEVRRRGFRAVENAGQFVIFCNRDAISIVV